MTNRSTPIVAAPEQSQAARFVTVFAPSRAPHLARIATEIQAAAEQDFNQVLSDTARATRFYVSVASAARAIAAFERFRATLRRRLGIKQT